MTGSAMMRLVLALLLAMGAMADASACPATITPASPEALVAFEPLSGEDGVVDVDLSIAVAGDDDCRLSLQALSDAPGAVRKAGPVGEQLRWRVESASGIELTSDPGRPLALPPPERGLIRVPLSLRVPRGQAAPAGRFDDAILLRLIDAMGGQSAELRLPVSIVVAPRAEVNIAGGMADDGAFSFTRLDFGELEQGETLTARLQLRATSPVTIHVSSEHRGMLRRVGGEDDPGLAYSLAIAGQRLALGAGPQQIRRETAIRLEGERYPILVEITGNPAALPAGRYRDLVTIDVAPN